MSSNGLIMNGRTNGTINGFKKSHSNGHYHNGQADNMTEDSIAFLENVFQIMVEEGVSENFDETSKVVEFLHPKELMSKLDLDITDKGADEEELLQACRDTLRYSVKTGHPHFFNQLFGGFDKVGLAGAWLTETANTSQYTFEVAPVFTLMEQVVLKKMRDILGYTKGDGIFCPGGSISNMYAVNLARHRKFPQIKTEGMGNIKMCFFVSEGGHYSMKKAAAFLGIGVNNVRAVPVDQRGKMIPEELEKMIIQSKKEGYQPFFVCAMSGTTVVGAYDPLNPIADICEKYGLWMHVDCCWGGGALLSRKHRHLMTGVERSDSVAWNPHKMMGTPLQCCVFLTQHEGLLQSAHCANATYLFQQDKFYDTSFDTGDKSIQCGRKVDVFKLWLMWKSKGNYGFEAEINNAFEQSKYLTKLVQEREGFRLVYKEPECTNVCFWYIPPSLRGKPETPEWWDRLSKVAPKIKERMVMEGTMLVGYQPQGNNVNFFRMVVSNLKSTSEDMEFAVDEIARLGNDL